MDKAVIILTNDKIKTYRVIIVLLTIINCVLLTLIRMRTTEDSLGGLFAIGTIGSSMGAFTMSVFSKKSKEIYFRSMAASTLLSSFAWFFMGYGVAGLTLIFLSVMALKTLKQLIIIFDKTGIDYPSFPRKKISWAETENVQLKDNILTIDLKNNKLMQFTLNEKVNPDLNEDDFNSFVKGCI